MRIRLIILTLAMSIMTTTCGTTSPLGTPPLDDASVRRTPYTGMNDLLLPAAPFKSVLVYEGYRFEPIVLIDEKNKTLEYETYIFVEPNTSTKHVKLSDTVKSWYAQVQKSNNVKFHLIKQSSVKIAGVNARYLIIESKGYSEKLAKDHVYIHHIYLLPTERNSFAVIRLSRLKENDRKDSELWRQWKDYIKSIKCFEPDSAGLTTIGHADNARRYYAHNLSFDLPLGDSRELNIWIIENAAYRKDTWATKTGDIILRISLIDDYDFSVEKENADYKQEADAMEAGGAAYFEKLTGEKNLDYEKIEIPFGNKNTFYGYIEKSETYSEFPLNAAYKTGRAIEIVFEAKNEVFEQHKKEIVDWVKHIIVLP